MHIQNSNKSLSVGKLYTCIYRKEPLYNAIIEQTSGCWATVKVVNAFPGKHEHLYKAGQALNIKMQYYEFLEA